MFFKKTFILVLLNLFYCLSFSLAFETTLEKIVVNVKDSGPYIAGENEIKDKSIAVVVDLLNYPLGANLISRGLFGAQQDLSLRGGNFEQNAVMINNQRVNDPQTGHFNLDLPLTIEDIDFVKIEQHSLISNSTTGGVNFITKRPLENKFVLKTLGGNFGANSELISSSFFKDNIGNRISLERDQSDGFQPYTDSKVLNLFESFYYGGSESSLDLNFGFNEKEFGAYDFYTPGKGFPSKEKMRTKFISARSEFLKDSIKFKPNFFWRRHYDSFMLDQNQPNLYLNNHKSDVFSLGLEVDLSLGVFGEAAFGSEARQEYINSLRLGKDNRLAYGFYINDKLPLNSDLSFNFGARFDDYDDFDPEFSGLAGIEYLLHDYIIHFNVSRSARIPTYTELYYVDSTTKGDCALKGESAVNYEFGFEKKLENYSFGQNVFFRDERNTIDWVKLQNDLFWRAKNINAACFGVENYLTMRPNKHFDVNFNYSYMNKPENKAFSYKYGPSNIQHLIGSGLNLYFGRILQSFDSVFKKKPQRNGWFLLNTKTVFNFNSGWLKNNCQIFLETNNLLNVGYEEISGTPSPGRLVRTGVRLEW